MKSIAELISQFKGIIIERGHPDKIVWLQEKQMWPTSKCLYLNVVNGFPYQLHVEETYNKLEGNLECGATLMLVAVDSGVSYCTLLLDTFGSNHDVEIVEDEFYFWCDPYCHKVEYIKSMRKWLYTKIAQKRLLSNLDYAFVVEQAFQ